MSSRTRTRTVKTAAGVHTVRLPRQRGRRSEPFVIVVPERPSLTRELFGLLGGCLWRFRRSLAPTALGVLALGVAAVLHAMAWWSGLVLTPAAVAPLVWLAIVQRRHPVSGSALVWRIALSIASTLAAALMAATAAFGPLAEPLPLLWLLGLIGAQTSWFFVRRSL